MELPDLPEEEQPKFFELLDQLSKPHCDAFAEAMQEFVNTWVARFEIHQLPRPVSIRILLDVIGGAHGGLMLSAIADAGMSPQARDHLIEKRLAFTREIALGLHGTYDALLKRYQKREGKYQKREDE